MDTLGIDELEKSLTHLPAYKIYDFFEKQKYENYCEIYFKEVLELQGKHDGIKDLCYNIGGIFKNIYEEFQKEKDITEKCAYLNFYLYNKIKKKFGSNKTTDVQNIISAFFDGWFKIKEELLNRNCSSKYDSLNTDLEKWKGMKCMYDYNKNYSYIEKNYSNNDEQCKSYIQYLKSIIPLYVKYKGECCSSGYACVFYYYYCEQRGNPDELLEKLKSHLKQKETLQSLGPGNDVGSHEGQPLIGEFPAKGEEGDNDTSINPLKISMFVINPLIGSILVFYLLNKFSPLGHWIRSKMHRNINIKHISDNEDNNEVLGYTSEYADIDLNDIPYNISYQHI
ncbi:PIR Superfamily Protein [Plasmodium ovale wallikeri]|uniref:PIR Superfamily Protein n=1 Tax=Plasmodium ovale wallikeri TaxID=864142 RepID=A0A1A9ALZ3_PLAOA|nr:PIR Superfamily Protein [Plasmodium ovale wallikeri]SBT57233.1 PIR Superfamily Protein [Plasmodium ovale wallikeri]